MKTASVKVNIDKLEHIFKELIKKFNYQELEPKNVYEYKRLRNEDSTLVIYRSGKIVLRGENIEEIEDFLLTFSNLKNYEGYSTLIGIDETGKGELFGPIVICGVRIIKNQKNIEKAISTMDTKSNRYSIERYKNLFDKLIELGVIFEIEEIQPIETLPRTLNRLMFDKCINILDKLTSNYSDNGRIVIDNFGINQKEIEFISERYKNYEVIIESKSDENYLECKTASLLSRYHREKIMEDINKRYSVDGIEPGSGNIGNLQTKKWLKKWIELEGTIPYFVKRWDKVIKKLLEE
ncbi:MAG: hypothetical protein ACPL4C_03995 [Brevinematia bacterium]